MDIDDVILQVKRRKGRPNRGGRANRGGKANRARGQRGRGRGQNRGHDNDRLSRGRGRPSQRSRPPAEVRVPIQKLHMSSENQEMVRDMLKDLHDDDDDDDDDEEESDIVSEENDELDVDTEVHYWTTDRKLVLEDVKIAAQVRDIELVDNQCFNMMAVQKLMRNGFEKNRCIEALQLHDGDIGQSLEYLLCACFNLDLNLCSNEDKGYDGPQKGSDDGAVVQSRNKDVSWDQIFEAREEEKTALFAIYEDHFQEKIRNQVWSLGLSLPVLESFVNPVSEANVERKKNIEKAEKFEICRLYKKGSCRHGDKCRYKHVVPYHESDVRNQHRALEKAEKEKCPFELEIRFPKNCRYPFEVPLIAFSSSLYNFPSYLCLHIVDYLLLQTVELAESGQPMVFTLVSSLNQEVVQDLVNKPPLEFSLPELACQQECVSKETQTLHEAHVTCTDKPSLKMKSADAESKVATQIFTSKTKKESTTKNSSLLEKVLGPNRQKTKTKSKNFIEMKKENKLLKDQFKKKQTFLAYKAMQKNRSRLPAWSAQGQILETLRYNQVLVISGMTGCGKTTQVPQYILDSFLLLPDLNMCNIVCTQPRRISAVSVAERVAEERVEQVGRTVGYQIRLENVQSSLTRLLFCTTGIVLRNLEGDPLLEDVTHLIIDEVHERSDESDFLMMVVKDLLSFRKDLKLILMSATLNADLFSAYFDDCPVIDIPGKTFPVDQFFLEDGIEFTRFVMDDRSPYAKQTKNVNAVRTKGKGLGIQPELLLELEMDFDELENIDSSQPASDRIVDQNLTLKQLFWRYPDFKKSTVKTLFMMDPDKINFDLIEELLEWIVSGSHKYPPDGAILVFLPGFAEIQTLYEMLQNNPAFGNSGERRFKIIPLHSTLSSEDQKAVFCRPKEGVVKIVIATNIAETSITIDDIIYVIDSGKMKEKRYDSSKSMESLDLVWVSKANALQRKGRAGRVASGVCFHLFTRHRFEHHLREQQIPEIQRVPLEQIVLRIKMIEVFKQKNVQAVLEKLLEPPSQEAISDAVKRLEDLGALDKHEELTPLGYHLGSLPVDVRIGKLMVLGAIFRCLDSALTIAATLSFKSPFVSPFDKRDEANKKKLEFAVGNSDHLTMLSAYKGWIEVKKRRLHEAHSFCYRNFLSHRTLQMLASMKQQFVELLSDIGFVKEGLKAKHIERAARNGGDGISETTGMEANCNSDNWKLVSAILVGALYPNVVQVQTPCTKFSHCSAGSVVKLPNAEELKFKTKSDGNVYIHPSSVNFQVRHYESPYLVYHEKVKTSKVFIRDCTMVSVYPLLLFGGGNTSIDLEKGNFILSVDDGWIKFMATSHQVAELVQELRMQLDLLLADKIQNPNMDLCTCPRGSRIIDTIVTLISTQ